MIKYMLIHSALVFIYFGSCSTEDVRKFKEANFATSVAIITFAPVFVMSKIGRVYLNEAKCE